MSDHQPVTLVILGASGDLTHRLLLPGLGTLLRARPALDVTLVGAAFDDLDDATWRERVREALADDTIPIAGVLCFLEADWPLLGGAFTVDEVHVVWPRLLVKRMTEAPGVALDVRAAYGRVAEAFPAA